MGVARGGFAAGDADDAEDGDFGKGGTRNKDAICGGVEVWWCDLDPVVEERNEIVGNDTFESLAVDVAEADPKTVELGPA